VDVPQPGDGGQTPGRGDRRPWAIQLYETISYDYDRFGKPSQADALRALAIDRAITDYLVGHSNVTVVGEGLQTSYCRLGCLASTGCRWTWRR
jgi:O-methyltransferase involved in polyketide biosynthesis